MKRSFVVVLLLVVMTLILPGCGPTEVVPKDEKLEVLKPNDGTDTLEKTQPLEKDMELITTYDTAGYDLSRWRITDSKIINMTARVTGIPAGATVMIEHVHIDMSLKSLHPQLDGLVQDSMDDSFHGSSQDGFLVNEQYPYQNKFSVEGFSKDIISGWTFICGEYGAGTISSHRLTEENLIQYGKVYANKMQVVYDILVKYENENCFHVVSLSDEFLISVEEAEGEVTE